ncbi:hypothetical protein DXG01_015050 [Tephrocybe rancida]|nr:hypothetical protein DXG01_015050 [Tephrocybe rancida]
MSVCCGPSDLLRHEQVQDLDQIIRIDSTPRHHIELVVIDDELNELIDLVCSRQGCALEHDRIFATFATIVGLVGHNLGPAVTITVHIRFYGPLPNQTEAKRQKLNPFLDLEADEDLREDADFLDDTKGDDEFDNFIDDHEVASGGRPPMFLLPGEEDKNLNNDDDEIFSDEDQYLDNKYPLTAAAVSHKALASHNNMEQWRLLLEHAYEWAREHQPAYQRPECEYFDDGLKPLPPALIYRVRVKDGYEETAAMNPGGEGADVLVVPRVEQFLNQTKGKGRAGQPPQQLLECKQAIRLFGASAVVAHNELNFTYWGQKYGDGLHYLVTHDFEPTVPTHEELALFQCCSFVDLVDIAHATNEIVALSLQVTDCFVVTSGELISMTGIVKEFSGNDKEATIRIDSEIAIDIVISPMLLRKVVAVDGTELHVWEDKTALLFKVNVNCVALHHDAQALSRVVLKQDVNWQPFEESQHPPLCRNLVYLGRRVMVIRRGVFKGYKGIIREILEDDEVRIELSATLKRKVFHLSQLSNLNDEKRKPLVYKYSAKIFQANMPLPAQPVQIPQSLVPLTPSTPLPAGSSLDIGPAWNPSLRTPDSRLQFPCNPYMDHWCANLTCWKSGDYEGKKGLWKVSDMMKASIARVQILVPPTTIHIPEMYVTPLRPTRPQEVVIIDDDRNYSCWRIYLVLCVSADGSSCDVQEKASSDKKGFITLPTNILAVIV